MPGFRDGTGRRRQFPVAAGANLGSASAAVLVTVLREGAVFAPLVRQ